MEFEWIRMKRYVCVYVDWIALSEKSTWHLLWKCILRKTPKKCHKQKRGTKELSRVSYSEFEAKRVPWFQYKSIGLKRITNCKNERKKEKKDLRRHILITRKIKSQEREWYNLLSIMTQLFVINHKITKTIPINREITKGNGMGSQQHGKILIIELINRMR